jgi:hypothetical protein
VHLGHPGRGGGGHRPFGVGEEGGEDDGLEPWERNNLDPWPEESQRWLAVRFARMTGQPFSEALSMHPRDMETWIVQIEQDATEARFEAKHQQ